MATVIKLPTAKTVEARIKEKAHAIAMEFWPGMCASRGWQPESEDAVELYDRLLVIFETACSPEARARALAGGSIE